MYRKFRCLALCLVFSLIFPFVNGCSEKADSAANRSPEDRPASVDKEAVWVGGADGGVYVLVTKLAGAAPDTYQARIYHANGDPWYQGALVLNPQGSKPLDLQDSKQYSGWDGDTLHLSDGRYLKSKEPVD